MRERGGRAEGVTADRAGRAGEGRRAGEAGSAEAGPAVSKPVPTGPSRGRTRRGAGWPLRVLLLAAAVMLLLTLPVIVVLPVLHRVDDEAARLQAAVSASFELSAAATANEDAQAALLAFLASTDATQRAALLNHSVERAQYSRSVQEKLANAAGDPATGALWSQLQSHWQTATAASTALAGALMSSPAAHAAVSAISAEVAAHQAVADDLAALTERYQKAVTDLAASLQADARGAHGSLLSVYAGSAAVLLVSLVAGLPYVRRWARRDRQRDRMSRRTEAEARLQRAYEMAETEQETITMTRRALGELLGPFPARLQLADSSHAHLTTLLDTATHPPACSPASPNQCPVAARGQPCTFSDSQALDACPRLSTGAPAVTCAPVSVAGRSVGVAQVLAPEAASRDALDEDAAATLLLIARRLGDRLTMLRAFARSERRARTDPLTGLLNRRSLEEQLDTVLPRGSGYAVAFIDLDHFKKLNDTYGHAAGDRALQLFAGILRRRVRPQDLIGRWGGEEFLVVFPDAERATAIDVMGRIRADLLDTIAGSGAPGFTISCGIASSTDAETFEEVIGDADQALLAAKSSGRDRVIDFATLS